MWQEVAFENFHLQLRSHQSIILTLICVCCKSSCDCQHRWYLYLANLSWKKLSNVNILIDGSLCILFIY